MQDGKESISRSVTELNNKLKLVDQAIAVLLQRLEEEYRNRGEFCPDKESAPAGGQTSTCQAERPGKHDTR